MCLEAMCDAPETPYRNATLKIPLDNPVPYLTKVEYIAPPGVIPVAPFRVCELPDDFHADWSDYNFDFKGSLRYRYYQPKFLATGRYGTNPAQPKRNIASSN